MGRDITLYPEKATRKELRDYIENLAFERCTHLWDWPKGTLNYSWFDHEDFKSITGVSADIYPISEDELSITGNEWALHVRNVYSASWYDVHMLNEVLRGARKRFGGTIKGDYGTNRYAPLWENKSTPISRGISAVYIHVDQELKAVKYALPDPSFSSPQLAGEKFKPLLEITRRLDPSRAIYNGLVPFAVAMFEYFFSQAFQILIAYDKFALEKRVNYTAKFEFSEVLDVYNKNRSQENLIAEKYTFQNLDQLNKAYKDWLNIDVRAILFKKKRIGKSVTFLENRISEIIQYRHGIVHHFAVDRNLTKDDYVHILDAISMAIEEFVLFVEQKYSIEIDRM